MSSLNTKLLVQGTSLPPPLSVLASGHLEHPPKNTFSVCVRVWLGTMGFYLGLEIMLSGVTLGFANYEARGRNFRGGSESSPTVHTHSLATYLSFSPKSPR